MRRDTSDVRKAQARRARPIVEGLEDRWVMSASAGGRSTVAAAVRGPGRGTFSNGFHQFRYTTSEGTRVKIQLIGKGSLQGTNVGPEGLNLVFSRTNSISRIVSSVHGGTGYAPLASIISRDLLQNGAANSLNGTGSPLVRLINLRHYDLVSGGYVNLSGGVLQIALNSMAPNSQMILREIPPSQDLLAQSDDESDGTSSGLLTSPESTSTGQYITNFFLVQTLAGSEGEFVSAGNVVLVSDPTEPGPPPAPPGVVVMVEHIRGALTGPVDLLTDSRIFGYDPATGRILRFALDLTAGTGTVDTAFAPIPFQPAGSTTPVGVALGRDGERQVLLASDGSRVSVYDATYGTALGSFATDAGFSGLGSTDYLTVLGNPQTDELQLIDVAASLDAGRAVLGTSNPDELSAPAGFSLLGGLTGRPGSTRVYSTVAATFNTFQPTVTELGVMTSNTATVRTIGRGGITLNNVLSRVNEQAIVTNGVYVDVAPGNPDGIGLALGSVDRDLALNTQRTDTTDPNNPVTVPNVVRLLAADNLSPQGTIVLAYPNQLTDLSETFRPDLAGAALIDVQGNIQSVRGQDATGLVLNNTGSLNLLRFDTLANSTIVGEPFGQLEVHNRSNVTILSTARSVGGRNDVTIVPGLQPIGPLSLPNDSPQA